MNVKTVLATQTWKWTMYFGINFCGGMGGKRLVYCGPFLGEGIQYEWKAFWAGSWGLKVGKCTEDILPLPDAKVHTNFHASSISPTPVPDNRQLVSRDRFKPDNIPEFEGINDVPFPRRITNFISCRSLLWPNENVWLMQLACIGLWESTYTNETSANVEKLLCGQF